MAFNILEMLNSTTMSMAENTEDYTSIVLDYKDIVVTKHNKYSMNELQEMATGIAMDGLQEPLILGRINGEYWLVSGHRRIAGIDILVQEGNEKYRKVDCRYKDMTETWFKIALLCGNSFNRKMTDYDLMMQAEEWKGVLTQARKEKAIKLEKGERIRDYVAAVLGETTGKIGTLATINKNATQEIKEEFKTGNIGITAAAAASQLPQEDQEEIAKDIKDGWDVRAEDIQRMADNKKRKTKEDEAKEQNVSDTDTTEEEKENARKLHALKMIEKYYIYLSQEETEILERILEDCKRRKREYAIEED